MKHRTATIGFGTTSARYYKQFDKLADAVRFARSYKEGQTPMFNLLYDGDEYFHVSENIERIAKENGI